MKHFFTFVLFALCSVAFAQDFKQEWKEVIQFELDGKVKSAHEAVDAIYKKAKRKKYDDQVIKCFFYQSKFILFTTEDAQGIILKNLKQEIKESKGSKKALLNYVYASILERYSEIYHQSISERTKLKQTDSKDWKTWTYFDFYNEISGTYLNLLKDEKTLRAANIKEFASVLEISPYTDTKTLSVYDFLLEKVLDYYTKGIYVDSRRDGLELSEALFKKPAEFTLFKTDSIKNPGLKIAVELMQENERYCLKNDNTDIYDLQYDRMKRFSKYFDNAGYRFSKIEELMQSTTNTYLLQRLRVDKAAYYYSITSKRGEKNYYPEALETIETVLNTPENPNAKSDAETLKEKILAKRIILDIPDKLYQNQNYRAFINYRNIDTLTLSYYRIPIQILKMLDKNNPYYYQKKYPAQPINADSLLQVYIKNHRPFKTTLKIMPPKTDHFDYTTEVLMDNLDLGNYLVYLETKNPLGYPGEKAYTYHLIQVSNLDYVKENENVDIFQVMNRKTGQPLENVLVKNNAEILKTNKNGIVSLKGIPPGTTPVFDDLMFVSGKDTLFVNEYRRPAFYEEGKEKERERDIDAKAMVFFDRAIYRPGQKVYFKGYMFKNKDKTKSVVPHLTVHIELSDASGNNVKKFDIQTNELGSFTGEYDIPKNALTGQFNLTVDEPDSYEKDVNYYDKKSNKHSFWDYLDNYDYSKFWFNVEEYKRPTFEITFNQIKENYTIGDTLSVTGNAKTLAGSNLTNAKVSYSISKSIIETNGNYDSNNHFIESETTTDDDGNFKIEIVANHNDLPLNEIEKISYSLSLVVTDLNGETRTAQSYVEAGQKMLKLQCRIAPNILQEEPGSFQIGATTLNNFPIKTAGTLTLYVQDQKDFLIKRRRYPEISAIERSQFEKLFPYEAYDIKDTEFHEDKVLTLPFDTEKSENMDLSFLKKLKLGRYRIVLTALDKKGNEVKTESRFELGSKTNNKPSQKTLFTCNQLKAEKGFFAFEIKSVIPDLYVTTRMYYGRERKSETVVQLKNGSSIVRLPRSANNTIDDVAFLFSAIWENNYEKSITTISQEEIEPKLEFEVRSMRNKIEPGSNENWSFIIKDSKMQAEVLASMYDKSLDQFTTANWNFQDFYHQGFTPVLEHETSYWQDTSFRMNNLYFFERYYRVVDFDPRIEWFGFDFNNRSSYTNNGYMKRFSAEASVPKNTRSIYGIIKDQQGYPLPGANVIVKGTNRSTQTDFDGYFEIEAKVGEMLVFSFIGMNNYTVEVGKEKSIDLVLSENNVKLEEVVVQGYGMVKKEKLNSATTTITSEIFERPNANFLEALQSLASGVNLAFNSGNPGSNGVSVIIRGKSAINANSDPLYIIDGVPMTSEGFRNLNADDIQSISILKTAAASALYGSRAANGVIVINTSAGKKELEQVKTRTNFNETAFFYPNLTTDEKGQVSFNFTTPESLTKWKLRLMAHNKKAQTGYFQSDIISQKDFMVMPNMPRFLREKDTITLSVKVVNLSLETKAGNAMLLLYDAATNKPIDALTMNTDNIRPFNCRAKQSVVVSWNITIPEGVQGLRYKVIAKSGNLSDGEENMLPVLTDKILVTESIPIWVRANTKREFTFENLKKNTSTTLQNHALTLEYTSNPVWIALQSLPYLMNYPHECAEQTFSKYYGNCISENILTQNPKVAALLDKWKNSKAPQSRLKLNEELKSIVLAETPWLMDAESEEQQNQRLALLMDLNAVRENNQKALAKLEAMMMPSGGFPWFSGGYENRYITQHILSGIGHLNKLFPNDSLKYKKIVAKGIPHLDQVFLQDYSKLEKYERPSTVNLNYLYMRSFFLKQYPLPKKLDSIVKLQLDYCKLDWLDYSLYQKGLLALAMDRYNEKDYARKIINSLKESISTNEEIGMYWIQNRSGYYWYDSPIETQALLIEAFAEIDNNKEIIDAMKVWLIKNKQVNNWPTTKSTTEAVYALLNYGNDWTSLKENTKIKIGDEKILTKKLAQKGDEMDAGYLKIKFEANEINSKMGTITVDNKTKAPGFGGVYWQYFETLEHIKVDTTKALSIDKKLFKKVKTAKGNELVDLKSESLKVGDLVTVRLIITTDTDLEFVHLKDLRASCLEPVDVLSAWEYRSNLGYYKTTRDVATNFFFDTIPKGTYVLEYDLRVTNTGVFNSGISTLQSMYAPEYGTHSLNTKINVTP